VTDARPKRVHHRLETLDVTAVGLVDRPGPDVNVTKRKPSSGPAFRRARARLAAYALHHKRPDMAREAGRKGGEATSKGYALGKQAWGVAMALRRWHGTPFRYIASRAPKAGPGDEGGGTPEPGPATARKVGRPPRHKNSGRAQQLSLL
jgi:general stress protein YciG